MQRFWKTALVVVIALLLTGSTLATADGPTLPKFELYSFGNNQPDAQVYLNDPRGIDIGPDGVYVSDLLNHRVIKYDLNGRLVWTFGHFGNGDGEFNQPTCVFFSNGNVTVIDRRNLRKQTISGDGKFISQTSVSAGEANQSCVGVATDPQGNVWRIDRGQHHVVKTSPTGQALLSIGQQGKINGQLSQPRGIAFTDGFLYVSDSGNCRVQVFDTNGQFVNAFGTCEQMQTPYDVAINQNLIAVADHWNSQVSLYTRSFQFIRSIGNGALQNPLAVEFDGEGQLLVSDLTHSVKVMSIQGELLQTISLPSDPTTNIPGLFHPNSLDLTAKRTVIIANGQDGENGDVLEMSEDGSQFRTIVTGLRGLNGIKVQGSTLFAAHANEITAINVESGQQLGSWMVSNANTRLHDVALDAAGNLFVSDETNNRVVKFGTEPAKGWHSNYYVGTRWMFGSAVVLDSKSASRAETSSRHSMTVTLKPGRYTASCPQLSGSAGCRIWAGSTLVKQSWNGIMPGPSAPFQAEGDMMFTVEIWATSQFRFDGITIAQALGK